MTRQTYPSYSSDEEWAFAAAELALMPLDAPQRTYELREVYNALRYLEDANESAICVHI